MQARVGTPALTAALFLSAVVALSLLAGCGDDDHHAAAPTASPTRAAASSTPALTATPTRAASNTAAPANTATATAPPSATGTSVPTATASETPSASPTATQAVSNPTIEGPVTGGHGNPWVQSTFFNLADVGYTQTEYFMTGTAQAYTNVGELGQDGRWTAAPGDTAPYKTRILVYRPADPQRFNGTLLVEWFNVSGGLDAAPDWTFMHTELIREGYAWLGVSAQIEGIEGGGGPFDLSLKVFDNERYRSLVHPGDSFSYDIYSQAAQAALHPQGLDPLGGLRPQRMIAVGESQSAFRLVTYVNAVHPLLHLFDGFFIHSRGNDGAPLSQSPQPDIEAPSVVRIRTDQPEPVMTFETETDLLILDYLPARQPDGPNFRLWEVAGTAHADTYSLNVGFSDKGDTAASAECLVVASPIPGFIECDSPINSGQQHFVIKAAIAALDRWVRGEGAPPLTPRLEITGTPPQFVLDELGNVRGGIRSPAVDVPLAKLSGLGQTGGNFCAIFGTTVPFDAATLATLYPQPEDYVAAVNTATDRAVTGGFIRPADAPLIKSGAEEFGAQCRQL
jgi:hypothetical protein